MYNHSSFTIIFALIAFSFLVSFSMDAYADQTEAQNISTTDSDSRRVQIFVQGENVYTVWTDDAPGNNDVFFSKSIAGESFSEYINLSNNNGSSAFPRIVVSEPNVYVVWYDYSPGQSDIFFAQSNDTGKNFNVIHIRSPEPSYNPWIASSSNYVYLVWNDGGRTSTIELPSGESRIVDVNTGDEEIFFGVSEDDGQTFEFSNLSESPGSMSWNPRIRAFDSNVFVVWNETQDSSDIFFSASTDNGKTFSVPINVSNIPESSKDAGIAVYENKIHLIWNQETSVSSDIFYAGSDDYGETFSDPVNLSNSDASSRIIRDAQITVSGNNVFLVWYENINEYSDVFFTRSFDAGLTFTKPINLSQSKAKSELPQIVVDNENVFVVWHDYIKGNGDIFVRESTDSGATFGSVRNLSDDKYESNIFVLGPQIFFSENRVYTTWQNKFENSTDLFLTSFTPNEKQEEGILLLSTLNDAINIEVSIDRKNLEIDELSNFTLKFFDSEEGVSLKDVHYSFQISDSQSQNILNLENQYSQSGVVSHSVTFSQEGPITILIDIHGTGTDPPFDTKSSGRASATITVVPEFPHSLMISIVGFSIIIALYHKFKLSQH